MSVEHKMIPNKIREEMKQLISISNCLRSDERRQRVELALGNFTQRCFDVIDKLAYLYLEEKKKGIKNGS